MPVKMFSNSILKMRGGRKKREKTQSFILIIKMHNFFALSLSQLSVLVLRFGQEIKVRNLASVFCLVVCTLFFVAVIVKNKRNIVEQELRIL